MVFRETFLQIQLRPLQHLIWQELNPRNSNMSEHISPHVMSESQTPNTALDPRCQSGPSAKNSVIPSEEGGETFLNTHITFAKLLIDQRALSLTEEWKLGTTVKNVRIWSIGWFVTFTHVHVVWRLHVTIRKLQTHIPCGVNLSWCL